MLAFGDEIYNACRKFLAQFLPTLVDEADFAADFLLLYRQDEEAKPSAATSEVVHLQSRSDSKGCAWRQSHVRLAC